MRLRNRRHAGACGPGRSKVGRVDAAPAGSTRLPLAFPPPQPMPTPTVPTPFSWGPFAVVSLVNLGLACCAVEFGAAFPPAASPDLRWHGSEFHSLPPHDGAAAHVLVVSGTVTTAMAADVLRAYEALPEPRYVISFGACSNSGGPYWDSYAVVQGVDRLFPVDVYVPGCPPRPQALLDGLALLRDRLAGEGRTA
jgi:NADH-quinone oxidoreductase subunit B